MYLIGVFYANLYENIFALRSNYKRMASQSGTLQINKWRELRMIIGIFSPDVFVVFIGLMIFLSPIKATPMTSLYRFILIPHFMMICLVLSLLQTPDTRRGLWRLVAESRIMTTIGYCSFPIYLLQQVLLNFYARIIYDDLRTGSFPIIKGGTDPDKYNVYGDNTWFGDKPWWWKLIAVICLVAFCWPIQRYYQDRLVAWLASKFMGTKLWMKFVSCWK